MQWPCLASWETSMRANLPGTIHGLAHSGYTRVIAIGRIESSRTNQSISIHRRATIGILSHSIGFHLFTARASAEYIRNKLRHSAFPLYTASTKHASRRDRSSPACQWVVRMPHVQGYHSRSQIPRVGSSRPSNFRFHVTTPRTLQAVQSPLQLPHDTGRLQSVPLGSERHRTALVSH